MRPLQLQLLKLFGHVPDVPLPVTAPLSTAYFACAECNGIYPSLVNGHCQDEECGSFHVYHIRTLVDHELARTARTLERIAKNQADRLRRGPQPLDATAYLTATTDPKDAA